MLVEIESLAKHYGPVVALAECSLRVAAGEVFGLLGPNGAGKTTLLRLLLGFLRPSAGRASVAGFDCSRQSLEVRRRVAYLPSEARLFRRMRGRDVLTFFSRLRAKTSAARAFALAERLELDLERVVGQMSTGMRQKLALAATLAADAPLVILDEPTANLDPTVRGDVLALVDEARRAGRAVLFSSHVLDEVEAISDRVAILRQGRLVHELRTSELRRQHRIRARLTGSLPPAPPEIAGQLAMRRWGDEIEIETPGELSPLLGWLAKAPLAEVRIEPVGLRAIYDRFHAPLTPTTGEERA